MSNLIIGGTSGLGLEIAKHMSSVGEDVIVAGRHDPEVSSLEYRHLDLAGGDLPQRMGRFVAELPPIKSLVYAAGFFQEGHMTELSDEDVDAMVDVGGRGLIFSVKKLLQEQGDLGELVTVTSTSQWVPRELEPVYNFVKAGAAHLSHGLSLDPRIDRTLVVGTSGMDTEFWCGTDRDTSSMMSAEWVAERIMDLRRLNAGYTFAKILGAIDGLPRRVEIVEPSQTFHDPLVEYPD